MCCTKCLVLAGVVQVFAVGSQQGCSVVKCLLPLFIIQRDREPDRGSWKSIDQVSWKAQRDKFIYQKRSLTAHWSYRYFFALSRGGWWWWWTVAVATKQPFRQWSREFSVSLAEKKTSLRQSLIDKMMFSYPTARRAVQHQALRATWYCRKLINKKVKCYLSERLRQYPTRWRSCYEDTPKHMWEL